MKKFTKLSILLSAAWFVVVCVLSATDSFRSYPHEMTDFLSYLFGGLALINLAIWGYRWISAGDSRRIE
jgi:purine-cytosine permease-like protein